MGCLQPDVLLGPQRREKRLGSREMPTSPNYEQPTGHDPRHSQNDFKTISTIKLSVYLYLRLEQACLLSN